MKKYTLVEILVSIAVIAILFGMAIGVTSYVKTKIARSNTQTTMKLIEMAFAKFKNYYGTYPYASQTDPQYLYLEKVDFSTADLKAKLWGYFNDVTADNDNPKIRGISLEYDSSTTPHRFYILDGWKNRILYINPGVFNTESFDLISKGEDGNYDQTDPTTATNKRNTLGGWNVENIGDDITNFTKN